MDGFVIQILRVFRSETWLTVDRALYGNMKAVPGDQEVFGPAPIDARSKTNIINISNRESKCPNVSMKSKKVYVCYLGAKSYSKLSRNWWFIVVDKFSYMGKKMMLFWNVFRSFVKYNEHHGWFDNPHSTGLWFGNQVDGLPGASQYGSILGWPRGVWASAYRYSGQEQMFKYF